MIDENELLTRIDNIKTIAKLPPIVDYGKYSAIVPYVELLQIVKELANVCEQGVITVDAKAKTAT